MAPGLGRPELPGGKGAASGSVREGKGAPLRARRGRPGEGRFCRLGRLCVRNRVCPAVVVWGLEGVGFVPGWSGEKQCFLGIGATWAGWELPQRAGNVSLLKIAHGEASDCCGAQKFSLAWC